MIRRLLDNELIVFASLLGGAALGLAGYGAVAGLLFGAAAIAVILQDVLKRRGAQHDEQPLQATNEDGEPNIRERMRKLESRILLLGKVLAAALALVPAAIAYHIATEQFGRWPWLAPAVGLAIWGVAGVALQRRFCKDD